MPALLTAQHCAGHVHLILGTNALAASRVAQSLAAGAQPIIISSSPSSSSSSSTTPSSPQPLSLAVKARLDASEATLHPTPFSPTLLLSLGRPETDHVVDAVFITDTRTFDSATIAATCHRARIPINVIDRPGLCSFSLLSVHVDGPLQIGVTTGGCGCRLAGRIRREVAAGLPRGLGGACERLGELRRRIREEDGGGCLERRGEKGEKGEEIGRGGEDGEDRENQEDDDDNNNAHDDSLDQSADFNKLVTTPTTTNPPSSSRTRCARWLAQACEYWPLKRLASLTAADLDALFSADLLSDTSPPALPHSHSPSSPTASSTGPLSENGDTTTTNSGRLGTLILAGTGTGDPSLLTLATYRALLSADLILADKLVPSAILDLIPRRTLPDASSSPRIHIARKFPGNADHAQSELLALAHAGLLAGAVVVRLKQGDPFVYGRGGEEVRFFAECGLAHRVRVVPGLSSALAAPLAAGIPVTQRGIADSVVVCTGVATGGKRGSVPGYEAARTGVFLMALNRVGSLVAELTGDDDDDEKKEEGSEQAPIQNEQEQPPPIKPWPQTTPCAVIERATCPDQRVIRTTLEHVAAAVAAEGSRPPGLLVVGRACEALWVKGEGDRRAWVVEEGFAGFGLEEGVF